MRDHGSLAQLTQYPHVRATANAAPNEAGTGACCSVCPISAFGACRQRDARHPAGAGSSRAAGGRACAAPIFDQKTLRKNDPLTPEVRSAGLGP